VLAQIWYTWIPHIPNVGRIWAHTMFLENILIGPSFSDYRVQLINLLLNKEHVLIVDHIVHIGNTNWLDDKI